MKPAFNWWVVCAIAGWFASTGVGQDAAGVNKSRAMEPRISVVTLDVGNLNRSFTVNKDGLGFPTKMTPASLDTRLGLTTILRLRKIRPSNHKTTQ
jgi:hypothetical protein